MKRIVIASEMHQIRKILQNIVKTDIIVPTKQDIYNELASMNIENEIRKCGFDISEDKAIEWIKKWPKRMTKENFIDYMSYDDTSIWWFMESWLYYSSVYYDSLRETLLSLQTMDFIIKKEQPDDVMFLNDGKLQSQVIKIVCKQRGIKTSQIDFSGFRKLYEIKRSVNTFLIGKYIDSGSFIRKLMWRTYRNKKTDDARKIVFFSTFAWEKIRNNGQLTMREPFNEPIVKELEKENKKILLVHIPIGNLLGLDEIRKKSKRENFTVIESYESRETRKETKETTEKIKQRWEKIKKDEKFTKSFTYDDVNIFDLVEKQFSCYFSTRLKGHIRDYTLIKNMIKKEEPLAVVYPGETSEFAKAAFHLCRKNKIPSVGLQHGMLHKYLGWIHDKGEADTNKINPRVCPIPDVTAVYGPVYKENLMKEGKYPEKCIFVSGAQRFDRITEQKGKFDRERFLSENKIPKNKKIISFITSPIQANWTETMTEEVLKTAKKLDFHVILKLHPSESRDVYEKIARKENADVTILRDVDLYEVLDFTDIVITHLSTAALEAMIFGKPVIVINLTGAPDRVPYVKEGSAYGVYKNGELEKTIKSIDAGNRKNTKNFVYKYTFKCDGKASKRIADMISRTIENIKQKK